MKNSKILLTGWLFLLQPLTTIGSVEDDVVASDTDETVSSIIKTPVVAAASTTDSTNASTTAAVDTTENSPDAISETTAISADTDDSSAATTASTTAVVSETIQDSSVAASSDVAAAVSTADDTATTSTDLSAVSRSVDTNSMDDQSIPDLAALTAASVQTMSAVQPSDSPATSVAALSTNASPVQTVSSSVANSVAAAPVAVTPSTNSSSSDITAAANMLTATSAMTAIDIPTAPVAITSVAETSSSDSTVLASSSATQQSSGSNSGFTTGAIDPNDVTLTLGTSQQIDLDTMTIGVGGNWLQKRVYYEQASVLCEEIQTLVSSCEDMRAQFWNELSSIEKNIENFYKLASYDQGKLDEMLSSYISALNAQQERMGDLSSDERAIKQTIVDEQAVVKQIGASITVMDEMSNKAYDVMDDVNAIINTCRSYQSKAWADFKSITQTLDDQEARTLYYNIEMYCANVQAQLDFLSNTLFSFFQTTLGGKISDNISTVESALSSLESKGVTLGTEIQKYFGDDLGTEQSLEQNEITTAEQQALDDYKQEQAAELQKKADAEAAAEKAAVESSWRYKFVTKVLCPIGSAFSWLGSKATFLEPVGSALKAGLCWIWNGCCAIATVLCCWLAKLKFW
jgi:hypothetical protein